MDNNEYLFINNYKDVCMRMGKLSFPYLTQNELSQAIDYSINKRFKNPNASVKNTYKNKTVNTTLADITNFILKKEPIMTAYGVLFKKHSEEYNPITEMLRQFMEGRDEYKKTMFKYPKGSEQYEKYNLLQLLAKRDANGFYGAMAAPSFVLFNAEIASSITTEGRSIISSASLLFESFLSNNVPFRSLNEVITFIDNVCKEKNRRRYNDNIYLDRAIPYEEVFFKIMYSTGNGYIPDENDLNIVWEIIMRLPQYDLNRLYYKNNLYEFVSNNTPLNLLKNILHNLNTPYLNPYKPPAEIKDDLEEFCNILKEYVYYDQQIIDRIDRMVNHPRNISVINDTDSSIISLDAWFRFVADKVKDEDLTIRHKQYDIRDINDNGDTNKEEYVTVTDFDFLNDEIVEKKRKVDTNKVIPEDGLRYSIVNIMAYCVSSIVNLHMINFCTQSHSLTPDRKCLIYFKNEFLFRRSLIKRDAKKHYASCVEVQEGNILANNMETKLDIKGFNALKKTTIAESTRNRLQKIIYDEILNSDKIDQVSLLKQIAIFCKEIKISLESGEKKYYKPMVIKSQDSYEDPMRNQGIKASYIYNYIKERNRTGIDLTKRNNIDIVKVYINNKNADLVRQTYPEVYNNIIKLLNSNEVDDITALAIPYGEDVPEWIIPFIDYSTIINDNVGGFPLQSCGLYFSNGKTPNNYSNILKI